MDSGLDQNESELGIGVLAELLQVLSDRDGLLDQAVEIFGDLRGKAYGIVLAPPIIILK